MSGSLTPAAARIGHIAEKRGVYFKHYRSITLELGLPLRA
jgi:hypothetical protein